MNFYDFTVKDLEAQEIKLSQYNGNVALVVNTASRCGFTSQYKALQDLYERYKDKGFVVLAFPSNDFGKQEPGSNDEIKQFCELKYRTTFPVFEKAAVSGSEKQPVYKFLTEQSDEKFQGDPGWNFVKFLINKDGEVVGRFSSMTSPLSSKITKQIDALIGSS